MAKYLVTNRRTRATMEVNQKRYDELAKDAGFMRGHTFEQIESKPLEAPIEPKSANK